MCQGQHEAVWWTEAVHIRNGFLLPLVTSFHYSSQDPYAARITFHPDPEREQHRRDLDDCAAASWSCPSCGRTVDPDHTEEDGDGERPEKGGLCPVCERARRELGAERPAVQERTGIVARLGARVADR
ncbi:hypothetical protein [Streptomyces wuyuanensis]|uniref:hypothetical protein n=1 Tax=Streptomyces wuyuanensis TaxID=1196353 RepID=UPI00371DCB56